MLEIAGKTLLRRILDEFKKQSINNVTVVAGYKADTIDPRGIDIRRNEDYDSTGELSSLVCARDRFQGNMLVCYGDLLFRSYVLRDLLDTPGEIVIVVDSQDGTHVSGSPDYAYCSRNDERALFRQDIELRHISEHETRELGVPSGRWIGMLLVRGEGLNWLNAALTELERREDFSRLTVPDLLNYLVEQDKPVKVHYIHGHWLDVNSIADLDRAGDFAQA